MSAAQPASVDDRETALAFIERDPAWFFRHSVRTCRACILRPAGDYRFMVDDVAPEDYGLIYRSGFVCFGCGREVNRAADTRYWVERVQSNV